MLKLRKTEARGLSLSGLVKSALNELSNIEQSDVVVDAQNLIKKIPYTHRKDLENGSDKAFDLANSAMDMLYKHKETDSNIKNVLKILDDIVSLIG